MTICFYQCLLREIPSQRRVLADQVPELLVVHHLYKCRLQTLTIVRDRILKDRFAMVQIHTPRSLELERGFIKGD